MVFSTVLFADVYATYEVKAVKEASLNLATQGIVSAIYVDVGSKVKKGQTLLVLNDNEEKASLEMSKSEYRFLKSQYERYEKSSEVFDKNTMEKLHSELTRAKNAQVVNEERVANKRLIAPFNGVITEKNIEVGDMASIGSKPLFRLVSNDIKLLLSFDSKYAEDVKIGDKFCFGLDGKSESKCATIYKIYPALNVDNKRLNAEANGVELKVGAFGDGNIKVKAK